MHNYLKSLWAKNLSLVFITYWNHGGKSIVDQFCRDDNFTGGGIPRIPLEFPNNNDMLGGVLSEKVT